MAASNKLNKTAPARKESGTRNGHSHKYSPNTTKKAGAPYTDYKEGHRHHIIRSDGGKFLRMESAGNPSHTHGA